MVTADYYYPDLECLVDFFCNPGLKNCWHGQLGIEPTTLDLCSQPRRPTLFANWVIDAYSYDNWLQTGRLGFNPQSGQIFDPNVLK